MNLHIRDNLSALSTHAHSGAGGDGASTITPVHVTLGAGMLQQSKGADIASANALALGGDGNYYHVTGTTQVNTITTKQAGTVIWLEFDSTPTVRHQAGAIVLQGAANWVASAGSVLTLMSEGSGVWREIARASSTTQTMGYAWVTPRPDLYNPGTFPADYSDGAAGNVAAMSFSFTIPTDLNTMVVATTYRVGGSSASMLGAFSSLTPGVIATVTDTVGGGGAKWYGMLVQWRA